MESENFPAGGEPREGGGERARTRTLKGLRVVAPDEIDLIQTLKTSVIPQFDYFQKEMYIMLPAWGDVRRAT